MIPFTESLRYEYPNLTPDSVVIDGGGYEGGFCAEIAQKYNCHVHCYEPIAEFYAQIVRRMAGNPKVVVHHAGLGANARKEVFHIKGCMSGIVAQGPEETVDIVPIQAVIMAHQPISVLKLNVENCEYEILEAILDAGLEGFIQNIQVQVHSGVPNCVARWAGIRNRLLMNYRITSEQPGFDNTWALFELK